MPTRGTEEVTPINSERFYKDKIQYHGVNGVKTGPTRGRQSWKIKRYRWKRRRRVTGLKSVGWIKDLQGTTDGLCEYECSLKKERRWEKNEGASEIFFSYLFRFATLSLPSLIYGK